MGLPFIFEQFISNHNLVLLLCKHEKVHRVIIDNERLELKPLTLLDGSTDATFRCSATFTFFTYSFMQSSFKFKTCFVTNQLSLCNVSEL